MNSLCVFIYINSVEAVPLYGVVCRNPDLGVRKKYVSARYILAELKKGFVNIKAVRSCGRVRLGA